MEESEMTYDTQLSDVWFLSFADSRLERPLKRITRQAKDFGFRDDHVLIATEENLDAQFRNRMRKYPVLGSRGFGYWSWKPQMVLQMFDKMPYHDYSDAGVHLRVSGKDRMLDYIALARDHGVVAFQLEGKSFQERYWTKGDVFDLLNARNEERITSSGQIAATAFIIAKNDQLFRLLTVGGMPLLSISTSGATRLQLRQTLRDLESIVSISHFSPYYLSYQIFTPYRTLNCCPKKTLNSHCVHAMTIRQDGAHTSYPLDGNCFACSQCLFKRKSNA